MVDGAAPRKYASWTATEDRLVLDGPVQPDPHLARELGRSVGAIQVRRYRLRRAGGPIGAPPAGLLVDRIPSKLATRLGLRPSERAAKEPVSGGAGSLTLYVPDDGRWCYLGAASGWTRPMTLPTYAPIIGAGTRWTTDGASG